ncbi:MAG TPA: hypothetical protein VHR97_01025 [Candidatus Baltobacteraceae bacterium]|jgi:hypothetical protein|nr:hypothetical protein [Candidatus Baltobacteraceae bacterium]
MDEYFIGAGALLTAGPAASIAGATLHAQPENGLAREIRAAVIDFESANMGELSRLVIAAGGWSAARFRIEVVEPMLARRDCTLADVFATLGHAVNTDKIHLFAHWTPDQHTLSALEDQGIRVVAHPLEAIGQASLVSGQRVHRWRSAVRAA